MYIHVGTCTHTCKCFWPIQNRYTSSCNRIATHPPSQGKQVWHVLYMYVFTVRYQSPLPTSDTLHHPSRLRQSHDSTYTHGSPQQSRLYGFWVLYIPAAKWRGVLFRPVTSLELTFPGVANCLTAAVSPVLHASNRGDIPSEPLTLVGERTAISTWPTIAAVHNYITTKVPPRGIVN